jgi:hypothetical protein
MGTLACIGTSNKVAWKSVQKRVVSRYKTCVGGGATIGRLFLLISTRTIVPTSYNNNNYYYYYYYYYLDTDFFNGVNCGWLASRRLIDAWWGTN